LDETVDGVIEAIQDTGRQAVKRSKEVFNYAADTDMEDARAYEAEVWWDQFATDERERLVDEFVGDD
jgi:enoyl-CoA hydratase/carnithine racemase